MYHGEVRKKKPNPKTTANKLSRATFFFIFGLIRKGFKNDIEEDDIFDVIPSYRSSRQGRKLEKILLQEREKVGAPSIYRLLWVRWGYYYLFLGVIQLIAKITVVIVQPEALGKLVGYFSKGKGTKGDAVYYATLLIVLNIVNCTYAHNYMLLITELGIRIKTSFSSLLYRKALKLSSAASSHVRIGQIVTLVTKDVNSFEAAVIFWNDIWISVILLTVTSYLMYSKIGVAALAGVVFLILMIPVQVCFGKLTSTLRTKAAKITDQRVQITQEALSAIKIIKMFTWESFFVTSISSIRRDEMKKIKRIFFAKATSMVIGGLVINFTLYVIVMVHMALGRNLTAEQVFFLIGCLHSLRSAVTTSIPMGILQSAEVVASAQRIQKVLTAEEHHTNKQQTIAHKPIVRLEKVWVRINNTDILRDVNLEITAGVNVVTGKLGGGKSSLLKTILEDYPVSQGNLTVDGSVSYAAEDPWLFAASIKQNILFGQRYDENRYRRVLQVCALEMDISSFEKGDNTIVDDRGVNLSKGQQARINLARAIYRNSDIYLLDDCLFPLDNHVQDFVFTECVLNFLKNKIVIMICHSERQIKQAHAVVIIENGTVKSHAKPSEIPDHQIAQLVGEDKKEDAINDKIDDDDKTQEQSKLIEDKTNLNIYHEEKKQGSVDLATYKAYFQFGGGFLVLFCIFVVFVTAQAASSYSEKLVSSWSNLQQNISKSINISQSRYEMLSKENDRILNVYTLVTVTSSVLLLSRAYAHFTFCRRASVLLHKSMITSVANATMAFFDVSYVGNVLNRFSKDLGNVDEHLPLTLYECLSLVCVFGGKIFLIVNVNKYFLIPISIVFTIFFFVRRVYLPTGRSLKRLEAATRSPVIGHLNATLEGLTTIKACGTETILREEFDKHQDLYTSACHMMQCTTRAFAYSLDMLCNLFIATIIISFLILYTDTEAGSVGLAITQALAMSGLLQWAIRQWAELENHMTSVERVLEYNNVKTENKTGQVLTDWPRYGKITYSDVRLSYGNSKDFVLQNVNFTISYQEKVGIVGRTGAGKSSMISILFRLYHSEGTITIDDVDINTLSLDFLRSNIAIIPQDPTLFTGTVRNNVDPTGRYSDDEIWKAMDVGHLKGLVPDLNTQITERGANFSSGQRQLICLTRAIVSKNKIIILDEATANMDPATDVAISEIIKRNFAACTVVTIAHRLRTVLHCDKVMVLDRGKIVEFDDTKKLIGNKDGIFHKMLKQANLLE